MNDSTRTGLGHFLLGLAIGLFLVPWVYLVTTRMEVAQAKEPVWIAAYVAVALVPGILLGLAGWNRAKAGPAVQDA